MVENGAEAVKAVENSDIYDIIFMYCQMPVMDGYETTEKIRKTMKQSNRDIPIIALPANFCTRG